MTQPLPLLLVRNRHVEQQDALRQMLQRHFANDPLVTYIDLSNAVDTLDPQLCYDGMHLTVAGNARVGASLAKALAGIVPRTQTALRRRNHTL